MKPARIRIKQIFVPFVLAITAVVVLAFLLYRHQQNCPQCFSLKTFTPEVIKHYILGFGPWAIAVYIILYAINTISLIPPIGIMSLTAGFIFGPLQGTIALSLGAFLGTTATFFISRLFGGKFVEQFSKGKVAEFQEKLDQNGFKVILFIRLIPLIPWELVNYASGLSRIKYRDYITATMIGIFPSIVVQTFFSDRLANFNLKDPTVIVAIGAFLLLGAVPAIYLKSRKKRAESREK